MTTVQSYFDSDNFDSRRTTGHNMFDPESFITGAELAQGFTYKNSHRVFNSQATYDAVVSGVLPSFTLPHVAPRVLNVDRTQPHQYERSI